MTEIAEFCRHPGDHEGCCQSLLQAERDTALDKHCIIEGLRANRLQCRQVLQKGLYEKTALRESPACKVTGAMARKKELEEACKQVVLFGYPLGIGAIHKVFYEAYHQLKVSGTHFQADRKKGAPTSFFIIAMGLYFGVVGSYRGRVSNIRPSGAVVMPEHVI